MSATGALLAIWAAAGGAGRPKVAFTGAGAFRSAFAVTDLAAGAWAAAGAAIAELIEAGTGRWPEVAIDRRLASFWFRASIRPLGWSLPPGGDPVAGDYRTRNGWIRLHTNAPHHRQAALAVLGAEPEREWVAAAVRTWDADALETAVVEAGGCAATMRSMEAWALHPQGRSVAAEPLLWRESRPAGRQGRVIDLARPLAGTRVLDLTRVLAGPVATRFLAGFGAEVLRIDPPFWQEPAIEPEMTLGKRCGRLDLRDKPARDRLQALLAEADVVVHGYRPGALDGLGFGEPDRRRLRPGLIDVSLDAYGWTGPWAGRRGFDSLVQMSAGIAAAGMRRFGADIPTPLPAQALDHTTGCILATAAIRGLSERERTGAGLVARASLARTAALLTSLPTAEDGPALERPDESDFDPVLEQTAWGPAQRLRPPLRIAGAPMRWDHAAGPLGAAEPSWGSAPSL